MIVKGNRSRLRSSHFTSELKDSRSSREWVEVLPSDQDPSNASPRALADRLTVEVAIQRLLPEHKPRPGQVESLYHLLYGQDDVILQAGTGYGKSVIFQLLPVLAKELRGVELSALMISPLNALTEQQISSLRKISSPSSVSGVAVTGHKNSRNDDYDKIGQGEYTHVCISPELVCDHRFKERVINQIEFRKDGVFLIVDEAHCIVQWSTFRREYGNFGALRLSLPGTTQTFGTSATLRPPIRNKIMDIGPFKRKTLRFINTSVDRPEIFIDIRFMEASKKNMEDLHWLMPQSITDAQVQKLRKTIVFFDNRKTARIACEHLRQWAILAGASREAANKAILPYYAILSQNTKDERLQDFVPRDSSIRILLATDAVGMGIDIAGVELVVQYGGERILQDIKELTTLMQRMGRAARVYGEYAAFVWIVEKWAKWPNGMAPPSLDQWKDMDLSWDREPHGISGEPGKKAKGIASKRPRGKGIPQSQVNQSQHTNPVGASRLSAVTTTDTSSGAHSDKRARLHPIYQLMLWDCPRRAMMKATYPEGSYFWRLPEFDNQRCCSFEHPGKKPKNLFPRSAADQVKLIKKMKSLKSAKIKGVERQKLLKLNSDFPLIGETKYYGVVRDKLLDWRYKTFTELTTSYTRSIPQCLIADDEIERISIMNTWLVGEYAVELFEHFVPDFDFHDRYGREIVQIVTAAVSDTTVPLIPMRQYKKQQEEKRNALLRAAFAIRLKNRRAWYGENIPKSEGPSDAVERANPDYQETEPVSITTVDGVTGRVDNQDPSWKNAEYARPATPTELEVSDYATSVADDEESVSENVGGDLSFLTETQVGFDESVGQSFCSTATTVVPSNTVNRPSTPDLRTSPAKRVPRRVGSLQRQNSRDGSPSTTPPPSPPTRTPTRAGRTPQPSRKAKEAWEASADGLGR